ncbi:cytochrome c oxidase assembly protein [Advenella mimigardefordensis]|uniref:Putative membrane protein n=1 Tax=Advenella mimigardefordensis (strain DSM 17166 / LMG 22922 / DPN7) TaxID=1247726 RepID=W0P8D6_ADVMD|nr:cytochrome c oxidase assembly protein [Advenella mimigardefordensis]AHG63124.1 putative membrane protein [Advenella mimigardefordensis DPN7]
MDLDLMQWLAPWEFSPTLIALFLLAGWLFVRGTRVHRVTLARQLLFWSGFVVLYLSLHTHVDYYAERMFFVHRIQHLVLHHLGPLLIMGAYPGQIMRAGLPLRARVWLRDYRRSFSGRFITGVLTNKILVPFLFVFLVLFWLLPTIQFYSMLDWRLYLFMNWSVVVSGFMYWNLILDRRPYIAPVLTARTRLGRFLQWTIASGTPAVLSPGARILSPIITMLPQMIVGAVITFTSTDIYPLFDLCGRALPMSAVTDQSIGGLTMWIPAAMVETFGLLFALSTMMRLSAKGRQKTSRQMREMRLAQQQLKAV